MIWTYDGQTARDLESRIEFQRTNFALRYNYFPVSSFNSFDEDLCGANEIIMIMSGDGRHLTEQEENSIYAASLGLDPSLPWTAFGLFGSGSNLDSIAPDVMEVMTEQMHRSTLETSYAARSFAERWADPVWEDMKIFFSSLRRQHLACECSHIRRHLRFSLILRMIEGAPAGFILLQSSLQLTRGEALLEHLLQARQAFMEPFPFTTEDLATELDLRKRHIQCSSNTAVPCHDRKTRRRATRRQRYRLRRLWMTRLARQGLRLSAQRRSCITSDGKLLITRPRRRD